MTPDALRFDQLHLRTIGHMVPSGFDNCVDEARNAGDRAGEISDRDFHLSACHVVNLVQREPEDTVDALEFPDFLEKLDGQIVVRDFFLHCQAPAKRYGDQHTKILEPCESIRRRVAPVQFDEKLNEVRS